MASPVVRFLQRFTALPAAMGGRIPVVGPRHRQLLLDTGRTLMMLAAAVLTHQLGKKGTGASSRDDAGFVFLGFLLWLLGAALTSLSLVARQFPRFAAAAVHVARSLFGWSKSGCGCGCCK